METEKSIFLIRHFATENNHNGVFMGRSIDPGIVTNNLPNPEAYKDMFLGRCKIYSSPSQRCIQTSDHILTAISKRTQSITIDESFSEVNYGDFEGKNIENIAKRFPKEYKTLINNPSAITFPNGDNLTKKINTAYEKMGDVSSEIDIDTIIIITHVDIIKGIIFRTLDINYDNKKYVRIDNGSITKLDFFAGGYRLCYLNMIL